MERYLKEEPKLRSLQKLPTELETAWDIFATPSVALSSWNVSEEEATERRMDTSSPTGISWDSAVTVVVKQEPLDDDYEDVELSCYELDLLRTTAPLKENKRLKRSDSNNNQASQSNLNLSAVKTEPRSSRHGSQRSTKQHNQTRNTSSSSHSDSSSTCSSSSSSRGHPKSIKQEKMDEDDEAEKMVQIKTESTMERKGSSQSSSCADSGDDLPLLTPPSSPESMRNALASSSSEAELALLGHQGLIRVSSANANISRSAALRLSTSGAGAAKSSTRSSNGGARILNVNQGLPTAAVTQRNANIPTAQASTGEWEWRLFFGEFN